MNHSMTGSGSSEFDHSHFSDSDTFSDSDDNAIDHDRTPTDISADYLYRPLSPSNPFYVICNGLCKSVTDKEGQSLTHIGGNDNILVNIPHQSQPSRRIALSSLPSELRTFLIRHQYPLVSECEGGCLPSWVTQDHIKLLTQLFDKHVKSDDTPAPSIRSQSKMVLTKHSNCPIVSKPAPHPASPSSSTSFSNNENSNANSHTGKASMFSVANEKENGTNGGIVLSHSASLPSPLTLSHSQSNSQHRSLSSQSSSNSNTPVPPPLLCPALAKQTLRVSEMIRKLYGLGSEERGHKLIGHSCLTRDDQLTAQSNHSDLLYGEVLPEGVTRMFDSDHLDLLSARTVVDLGSGLGKLALQAFIQFPHLDSVYGIELAKSRSAKGFEALKKLAKMKFSSSATSSGDTGLAGANSQSSIGMLEESKDCQTYRLTETIVQSTATYSKCLSRTKKSKKSRFVEFRCGDLFTMYEAFDSDVIVCETKFPEEKFIDLISFLNQIKVGARMLTYEDLDGVYQHCQQRNPFQRLESNHSNDRFYTSWAPNYGYRFHLWRKKEMSPTPSAMRKGDEEVKEGRCD